MIAGHKFGTTMPPVSGCADGRSGDGILICPPLCITQEEIEFLLRTLEETLAEVSNELGSTQ